MTHQQGGQNLPIALVGRHVVSAACHYCFGAVLRCAVHLLPHGPTLGLKSVASSRRLEQLLDQKGSHTQPERPYTDS